MIYQVSHHTRYTYSGPVFVEPHEVRLIPRADACQKINSFTLAVNPQPAGIHHYLDIENNCAICLWFGDKTGALDITTSFQVETVCPNPFTYLVSDSDFLQLPVKYSNSDALVLAPYRSVPAGNKDLLSFGKSVASEVNGRTLDFLTRLCQKIYQNFKVETREQGPPLPPDTTLKNKKGACRDLVMLFMTICRNYGLAARFVSGYQEGDSDMKHRQLHAWAEIYIPGGGWRGYDPSHGLVVADRHIALAASYDPNITIPVQGNFRGTGITAAMTYSISLTAV